MRQIMSLALLLSLLVTSAPAAAPPPRSRALTASEIAWLNRTAAKANEDLQAGMFEEAARLARQVYQFRRRVQGERHWQSVDVRLVLEDVQRLVKVPQADRVEVGRARSLNLRGVRLVNSGKYRDA